MDGGTPRASAPDTAGEHSPPMSCIVGLNCSTPPFAIAVRHAVAMGEFTYAHCGHRICPAGYTINKLRTTCTREHIMLL
jgi:hypothetical protein